MNGAAKVWLAACGGLAFGLAFGCDGSRRAQAEQALRAGELMRELRSIEAQKQALELFDALPCRDDEVCRVKTHCRPVSAATLQALELSARGRELIAALERSAAAGASSGAAAEPLDARALARESLDQASEKLEQAREAIAPCEAALGVLERAARSK